MSSRRLRGPGASLLAALLAAGCSLAASDDASSASALSPADEVAELDKVLGDDRVGRALHANPSAIPYTLSGVEAMFGIGRKCTRPDSHEIWAAEEKDSRLTGSQVLTPDLEPRLVVGGCNHDPSNPSAMRQTFELFLAVVSDPARPLEDPLSTTTVEAMALDDTTGLFNFYVLEPPTTAGAPGTVTRFVRTPNDVVEKWQKVSGQPATKGPNDTRKCFNCHIHGDPIMNEITEPWTNWVSSHKQFSRELTGDSRELVSEARPFHAEHTRSSLANALQQVVQSSLATWVEGFPGKPQSGLGAQILAGAQPGGVSALLRSVFCQTTVNYASAFDTVPLGLYVDASAAGLAGLQAPVGVGESSSWTLLPVRADVDLRMEVYLEKAKVLRPDTVMAVRLLDDTHDVFSAKRCALHDTVTARLASAPSVDDAVRTAVLDALQSDATVGAPRRDYIHALVDTSTPPDVRDSAESAYISDITARLAVETAKLQTEDGRAELRRRWLDRQASARALFSTAANPLPLTQ
jgi:hypothetical protein